VTPAAPVAVDPSEVVVPYDTLELETSLVVHVMVAPVLLGVAEIAEIVGGVVSPPAIKLPGVAGAAEKLPAASRDAT
jgi:hypothetical protein